MLITTLLTLAFGQDTLPVYSGRGNQLSVAIPRLEAPAAVDGRLDESVWSRAARLTDFSQFQPVDGRAAEEATEVLVWYAPDAIWFGIRARETHGNVVRATRANRDNIASEDHVQILLDTNNDRRLAFLFGVNALGVQQDGTRSDQFGGGAGGQSATGGGTGNINPLDGTVDLNPDYVFESRGRLVDGGYEVEVRIPFKSLRYQEAEVQNWGIHVLRRVQHSGYQDTWAPAVRANASFLGQSGTLTGLRELRRGLVLELTPTAVARLDGAPETPEGWDYASDGELSGDVRWGIRQNLTLNGTVNPDFSQVEADVGQVLLNERFSLFYPEKRPFFLDGLELFDTPNQLIYTRRIVSPEGGVKLAGKVASTNVATLVALDGKDQSWTGDNHPFFGVMRLRRDLGQNSTLGGVLTTREDGGDYSRLAGADLRLYHSRLYYVELQAVQSWTDSAGVSRSNPYLSATWDRTGRQWGFNYGVSAVGDGFNAAAGFVNRTGIIQAHVFNRLSFYGDQDDLVQTWGGFSRIQRIWDYRDPAGAIEGGESLYPSATLRGGWRLNGAINRDFFTYQPEFYQGFTVEVPGDTVGFSVPGRENNQWNGSFGITSPTWRVATANFAVSWGKTPIFVEAAPGSMLGLTGTVELRPTAGLRATAQLARLTLQRSRDDSRFSRETIPRLKLEYQLSRAIFFRLVGQYTARERSPLVDRSGNPILIGGVRDEGSTTNELRMDWLFSYRPIPGTLVYLGYGSTMEESRQFRFNDLERTVDGFFAKVSYVFRM
jgi:hypothetical protein